MSRAAWSIRTRSPPAAGGRIGVERAAELAAIVVAGARGEGRRVGRHTPQLALLLARCEELREHGILRARVAVRKARSLPAEPACERVDAGLIGRGHAVADGSQRGDQRSRPSYADASFTERFRREYRALAAIEHRGVPAIYDIGETSAGEPYFTMQIISGETIRARLNREKTIPPARALALLAPGGLAIRF